MTKDYNIVFYRTFGKMERDPFEILMRSCQPIVRANKYHTRWFLFSSALVPLLLIADTVEEDKKEIVELIKNLLIGSNLVLIAAYLAYGMGLVLINKICLHSKDIEILHKIALDEVSLFDLQIKVKACLSKNKVFGDKHIRISVPLLCSSNMYSLEELADAVNANKAKEKIAYLNIYYRNHLYTFFALLYKLEERRVYSGNKNAVVVRPFITEQLLNFLNICDILYLPQELKSQFNPIVTRYAKGFSGDKLLLAFQDYRNKLDRQIEQTKVAHRSEQIRASIDQDYDIENHPERMPLLSGLRIS